MNIKKKNFIFCLVGMFIFACLFTCGIFAVVTKSVSFNLALKLDPKIYFALELQIDYNGDGDYGDTQNNINESSTYKIFNNKTGTDVVSWATVNQNCIVLNQVLAGNILRDLSIKSKFKITVTNLTEKTSNEAEEYLHLTLDYDNQKEVFKADNGYGAVNMEYGVASGDASATKSFTLIPQTTLLNGYIQIPFLAEIDGYRYTATITTENCEIVSAPRIFTLDRNYKAQFYAPQGINAFYEYDVTIKGKAYDVNTQEDHFEIPYIDLIGDLVIDVYVEIIDPIHFENEVWDGSIASQFAYGDGTENNPFLIYNPKQLALVAYLVNNHNTASACEDVSYTQNGITTIVNETCGGDRTFSTAYYELRNNLVLNEGNLLNADGTPNTTVTANCIQWTSIGYTVDATIASLPFMGSFYGNYNIISGMYINKPSEAYPGLFAILASANTKIKTIGVINSVVITSTRAGIIVASGSGASLINSFSFGYSKTSSIVNNRHCVCGGIVGANVQLTNCYNLGRVVGSGQGSGGLIGYAYDTNMNIVSNSYNAGYVTSTTSTNVGSIIGMIETGSRSVTNSYYLTGTHANSGGGTAKSQTDMKSQAMADLLNGTQSPKVWGYNPDLNGGYPYILGFEDALTEFNEYFVNL